MPVLAYCLFPLAMILGVYILYRIDKKFTKIADEMESDNEKTNSNDKER